MSESGDKDQPSFIVVKSEAAMLKRRRLYDAAIKRYSKALELVVNDKNCLVAQSKCHLAIGDTRKALQEAETSIVADKKFHKGFLQKAEVMYHKGDFEKALMFYHRGNKLRPELQEFRLGIQKAQDAIENSVGTPERVKLNTTGDLSFFTEQEDKKRKAINAIFRSSAKLVTQSKRNLYRTPAHERTIKQMLGELYGDKNFLENLLSRTESATNKTSKTINDLSEEGLTYLDTRTEFWRQQKPMYARKYEGNVMSMKYCSKQKISDDHIICELEKIDEAMLLFKYKESLKRAQNCLLTVEGYTESQLANKMALKAQLHSCMGNAYLEMGIYNKAQQHHQEDLNIGEKYLFNDAISRGTDNLGRVFARMGEYEQAIRLWEQKLNKAKTPIEKTWLCHEIGRCHMELERSEKSKEYGLLSLEAAEFAGDKMWQLHALVLIAQAEVVLDKYSEARNHFKRALELARVLENKGAETAVERAMGEVDDKIAQGDNKLISTFHNEEMNEFLKKYSTPSMTYLANVENEDVNNEIKQNKLLDSAAEDKPESVKEDTEEPTAGDE